MVLYGGDQTKSINPHRGLDSPLLTKKG